MVGLRAVLDVVQRNAGEAPAPILVSAAERERGKGRELMEAQGGIGAFERRGQRRQHRVLVIEAHVEWRLRGVTQRRISEGKGAEAIGLSPLAGAIAPAVDVDAVVG